MIFLPNKFHIKLLRRKGYNPCFMYVKKGVKPNTFAKIYLDPNSEDGWFWRRREDKGK